MSDSTSTTVLSKITALRAFRPAAALFLGALAASAPAQTAPPQSAPPAPAPAAPPQSTGATLAAPAPGAGTTGSDVTALEKYTVSDTPIDEQILPTVRPISSVFGDDLDIVDIPRSVSTVNKAWMEDRQVKNAMDFGQFSPGVYSPANYGIPATPQIRGDYAQIYIDGQETLFTHNEVYPSFNGIEAMDIVKGPGSAIYGPQGEGPGGYVNLVTKQPYFDAQHTDISATFGYWTSGHSYSNPSLTIDTGGPITSKLAYRVSYLSQYGDGYYLYTKNTTQDLYAALTYLANSKFKLEWWGQYYWSRFNEVAGVNRVTQNFIWNGDYIAGPANAGYAGIFALLNPATAYTIKLPDDVSVEAPFDSNHARRFQSQLVATDSVSSALTIINRTYFENTAADQFEGFGYSEYEPLMASAQDRLEFHLTVDMGKIENDIIAGGDFRYTRQITYNDYALEPFPYFDLGQPQTDILMPGYTTYLNHTVGGGYQVPGAYGYSADPYSNGVQDNYIYDSALFAQDDVKITKDFTAILGLRGDHIEATDVNPALINATTGAYVPQGSLYSGAASVNNPSYFLSFVYKLTDTSSLYITYDRVNAIVGSTNFGGIGISESFNPADNNAAAWNSTMKQAEQTKSTLYEAGYKETLLGNRLYVSAALFQQLKEEPQIVGPPDQVKDNGLELESVFQVSRALSINANFTYQDATAYAPPGGFYQQTGNYLDFYPVGFIVDGQSGTGAGAINFGSTTPNITKIRAPGVPQVLANAFVDYKFPNGFGFGVGPRFNGEQPANDQDTLHIPGEVEWDGYLFYRQKHWDVRVNVNNILNARLLDPIDVSFAGNDLVYVRQPITASITFRLHF
jgi:outer membrane receptor for monomeric catechols